MKRRSIALLATIALAGMLCLLPGLAWGDAGGFSGSTDYGGSSSFGGSSSYDYGSSSGSSYYYGGSSSDSSSGGGSGLDIIVTAAVICLILFIVIKRYRNTDLSKLGGSRPAGATPTDASLLQPMQDICETDPAFKEEDLRRKISNVYVQMQNAWTAKDFTPMRPYFTDELYAQFDRQLDQLRSSRTTNRVDNIAVLGVDLRGWYEADGNQCVVADVRTRIIDYTVDDATGSVVSGSDTAEKFMTYEYTLVRTIGTITPEQTDETESTLCPNCGGVVDINRTAKCPYCGSIVTAKDFDWAISTIKGLSQETH